MELAETRVLREPWEVEPRLLELNLTREGLLAVRDVAMAERANATPFHPLNAAGTFAYQHATWALRDQFVGKDYIVDRTNGVEAIRDKSNDVRIAFANVDQACDISHQPKPRSNKGPGAERVSGGGLFGDLPDYVPRPDGSGPALYYLMVDEDGAAELTRPIIKGGTFTGAVERLFLSQGGDWEGNALLNDRDDVVDDFDPQIMRK